MNPESSRPESRTSAITRPFLFVSLVVAVSYVAACASSSTPSASSGSVPVLPPALNLTSTIDYSISPPTPDPRVGLKPGRTDAGEASWNMRLVSNTPASPNFAGVTNSDLAFTGPYAIQGNYNGYQVWDISNPRSPVLVTAFLCPASQSDVSVYKNLLFVSGESGSGRTDCGTQGVQDSVSPVRLRGIRIMDATDIRNPKYIANVQTCRGSHTHTVVSDPRDASNVYVYISGSSGVRSPTELPGCSGSPQGLNAEAALADNPNTALFRIEVIRVPLANPQLAAVVSSPRIFNMLAAAPSHGPSPADTGAAGGGRGGRGGGRGGAGAAAAGDTSAAGRAAAAAAAASGRAGRTGGAGGRGGGGAAPAGPRPGPNQCHDITVYPGVGLAGGACGGYGLLLDIRDVANPRRIDAVADSNFSYWHSATFSNDGSKVLFTDEWGGGSAPRCRALDKYEWGGNALFSIRNGKMVFESYYKMPAAQTSQENCVAHNGSLIPIPGREVMVQGWYQGGISIFDWTDVKRPKEIAFFDRGPMDSTRLVSAGSWSVYWYNGAIVNSEIARGLDIFEITPSPFLTQNEIDAANTVRFEQLNAQEQPKIVWPPSFALARAYVDQLERGNGLAANRISAIRGQLASAEQASGTARRTALTQLATQLNADAGGSRERARIQLLVGTVNDLAR